MEFEDRAVAFIDILGFKSLVLDSVKCDEALAQLSELVRLLSSAVPELNSTVNSSVPPRLIPKYIYISDCIILSAPLRDEACRSYDGLAVVVMRVIQISHYFLNAGYLIRGGISAGKTWHSDSNIIGPAYQEAYFLENTTSEPIVTLSDTAANLWSGGSRMCLQKDGKNFVNGLFDYYIPNNGQHGEIDRRYQRYAAIADGKLEEKLSPAVHAKWRWFRDFLNSEAPHGLKWEQA